MRTGLGGNRGMMALESDVFVNICLSALIFWRGDAIPKFE